MLLARRVLVKQLNAIKLSIAGLRIEIQTQKFLNTSQLRKQFKFAVRRPSLDHNIFNLLK